MPVRSNKLHVYIPLGIACLKEGIQGISDSHCPVLFAEQPVLPLCVSTCAISYSSLPVAG